MPPTPEHVRWSLAHACPLREGDDWQRPELSERQLRPLRVLGEAQREGRYIDEICITPEMAGGGTSPEDLWGFSAAEVAQAYGGLDHVKELCRECPANATAQLAGCFGCFNVPAPVAEFHAAVDTVLRQDGLLERFDAMFARARPRWYALWIDEVVGAEQLALLRQIMSGLAACNGCSADLLRAIEVSIETSVALHVTLVPGGQHEGHRWTVDAHCWRCKAPRTAASRSCGVCGQHGRATPRRVRNARGRRPYQPLVNFLSTGRVEQLLARCSK